ncbi:MAG: hypothetical protein Kow00121_38980 [Elainellaceae cyanobacterium]
MPTVPDSLMSSSPKSSPDYNGLVRFLVVPFLESPDSLKVDSEISRASRVLIRMAIEGEDKGRVFGRGGRNIQAIRTVVQAVAQATGQVAHLEIFGSQSGREHTEDRPHSAPRSSSHRPSRPRPR